MTRFRQQTLGAGIDGRTDFMFGEEMLGMTVDRGGVEIGGDCSLIFVFLPAFPSFPP